MTLSAVAVRAGRVALEFHPEGEQFLDDVVMQVARDVVVVFRLGQQDLVGPGPGEFHGHGSIVGEGGGHAQVRFGEPRASGRPPQQQRAEDPLTCRQRDGDQRAYPGAECRGCPPQGGRR